MRGFAKTARERARVVGNFRCMHLHKTPRAISHAA